MGPYTNCQWRFHRGKLSKRRNSSSFDTLHTEIAKSHHSKASHTRPHVARVAKDLFVQHNVNFLSWTDGFTQFIADRERLWWNKTMPSPPFNKSVNYISWIRPGNIQHLDQQLSSFNTLVGSMRCRCKACVNVNGYHALFTNLIQVRIPVFEGDKIVIIQRYKQEAYAF